MGGRVRGLAVLAVVLTVGVLAGSAAFQWRSRSGAGERGRPHAVGRVRVEVLNAGGHAGAARDATDQLRDLGFDVVYFGNASEFGRDSSVVLDRVRRVDAARDVADGLGIRNVRSEPDSNLFLDVSVVLGRDWVPVAPTAGVAKDTTHLSWWDPRGWFRR